MKQQERDALKSWESFHQELIHAATVDELETSAQQRMRIAKLEQDPEAWFKYYFPKYAFRAPAHFHLKSTKRIIHNTRWYEVRAWSRELAKSTRTMMEVIYLVMTGKVFNIMMVSNSEDNAKRLLLPYKLNLEKNKRLIKDYGLQEFAGRWEEGEFITTKNVAFRAIGAGQSPRGSKNEEIRPDVILIDDIDTDAECRNPERIKKKWKWIEQALIPTVSISGRYRIIICGNIIARDCTIKRAIEVADHAEIINIRDRNNKSSWPEKNSENDIDQILSKISYASQQKEYFNNPIEEGSVFKDITWDKVPSLKLFRFLVAYGDPAPSNKENKANCDKVVVLIGESKGKFYIINAYVQHVVNARFVTWYWDIEEYVNHQTQIYNYIENNTLQDPFYDQVFIPLFVEEGMKRNHHIGIIPDQRKKPDKFARIEGNLEPLNRQGRLIFNLSEKQNPNMKRLAEQFESVDPTLSSPVDGPDAVEGGVWVINNKLSAAAGMTLGDKRHNSKRY